MGLILDLFGCQFVSDFDIRISIFLLLASCGSTGLTTLSKVEGAR